MNPRRIVAFGSSSVHGTGDLDQGGFINRFRFWFESLTQINKVYNLGIWGETSQQLIKRIAPEASARRAELILLYPGFNDIQRKGSADAANIRSEAEFCHSVEELITAASAVAPVVMMTGFPFEESKTTPFSDFDSYFLLADARRYTQRLREICEEKSIGLIDFFEIFSKLSTDQFLAEDGLHCSAAGHQRLFEMLRDYFISRYQL